MTITMDRPADDNTWTTVELLNKFLRGELAAVDSYRLAIERTSDAEHRAILERCQDSHAGRAELLREAVEQHGGQPAKTAGPWGVLVRVIEGGATMLGPRAAVAALHEGERRGLEEYTEHVSEMSTPARNLLWRRIIPQQHMTEEAVRDLAEQLAA